MARYGSARITNATRGTWSRSSAGSRAVSHSASSGSICCPGSKPGEGLLLPGATTIDTTFMGYPIDLVFLDSSRRVTRVVPDMVPWRMVLSGHGGHDCLELPAGAAADSGTVVGDLLVLEEQ